MFPLLEKKSLKMAKEQMDNVHQCLSGKTIKKSVILNESVCFCTKCFKCHDNWSVAQLRCTVVHWNIHAANVGGGGHGGGGGRGKVISWHETTARWADAYAKMTFKTPKMYIISKKSTSACLWIHIISVTLPDICWVTAERLLLALSSLIPWFCCSGWVSNFWEKKVKLVESPLNIQKS